MTELNITSDVAIGKTSSHRSDLNAAWQEVNRAFDGTYDGLNIYEVPMANTLADTIETSPRFNEKVWSNVGILSIKNFPIGLKAQHPPKVFGVTDEFVEALDESSERIVMVRNQQGELWRTLHTINARGYEGLTELAGSNDLIVEGTKLSASEREMLGLWARRHAAGSNGFIPSNVENDSLQDIPHTSWLVRLAVEPQHKSAELVDHLRNCGTKVSSTAEQPTRLFNEKLEAFVNLETTRHKAYGTPYTVDRLPFADFTANLEKVYEKIGNYGSESPVLMNLEQELSVAAVAGVYRERLYVIGEEFAAENGIKPEQAPELLKKIGQHYEQSLEMLNVYSFESGNRSQELYENNAVLVTPEFVETLWQTMDSRFGDEVVLASPEKDYKTPYSVIWYGDRYLLTFIPSTIAGHTWLHIDTLPATEVSYEQVFDFRNLINIQLGKNSQ